MTVATFRSGPRSLSKTLILEFAAELDRVRYNMIVTMVPRIEHGYVCSIEGPGPGLDLRPQIRAWPDLAHR